MKLAFAFAFFSTVLPIAGQAKEIVLKSGARGVLSVSVIQAPERFGGPTAGNMIGLALTVTSAHRAIPDVDASSLCHLYGQSSYSLFQSNNARAEAFQDLVDLNAPLVGVRVSIFQSNTGSFSISRNRHFDMRGIVKCRPHS